MKISQLRNLVSEINSAFDLYESTGSNEFLADTREKADKLVRALERPSDVIIKLFFSPTIMVAVKVAHDLGIFELLSQATLPIQLDELAALKPADPLLVERIMRLMVACGFADEPVHGAYLPTAISKEMAQKSSAAIVESLIIDFLPCIQKIPEYLKSINYRNPNDPSFSGLQYAHNLTVDGFTWLGDNPELLTRFNNFMEGYRGNRPHWTEWFPVHGRIIDSEVLATDTPILVDIGAGRGYDLIKFSKWFPDAAGRLILEDLPTVIDEIRGAYDLETAGIWAVPFDFFADVQPVRDARAYYMKYVLHDWADEKAADILNNIKPAMKPGYSKLILEEFILPDTKAALLPCMTDLAVMLFSSGLERNRQRWSNLMESVGLKILKFWVPKGDGMGIIEVELPEADEKREGST